MCEPFTIATAAVVVGAAIVKASGESRKGRELSAQAEFNAAVAQRQASDAIDRGNQQIGESRIKGSALASKQQGAYAAAGVDPSVGTASDVVSATHLYADMEGAVARSNAAREAFGYRANALSQAMQAKLSTEAGQQGALGSILGGAGQGMSILAAG